MKKTISMALALLMLLSILTACNSAEQGSSPSGTTTSPKPDVSSTSGGEDTEIVPDFEWLKGKTITLYCGSSAGSSGDIYQRNLASYWEKYAGCTFNIVNIEGASGQIADTTFFSQKDKNCEAITGIAQTFLATNLYLGDYTPDFTVDDYACINLEQVDRCTISVLTDSPYETIDDLIEAIQANPGQLKCAVNSGAAGMIALKILKDNLDLDFKIVVYSSGSEKRTALLGGHADFMVGTEVGDNALGDAAHPLVICGDVRSEAWPDVPAAEEIWPGLGLTSAISTCRGIAVDRADAEAYPERFLALVETYKQTFESEEYQAAMEKEGNLAISTYLGPEASDDLNRQICEYVVTYKEAFEMY